MTGVSGMGVSTVPEIVPLFATPLVTLDQTDAEALNLELRRTIEQREKTHPTTQKSNMGGWQSSWDMDAGAARQPSSCWPSPAISPTG